MRIGIPKETLADERRVAATPASVKRLIKLGYDVSVERDAGLQGSFADDAYEAVGASVVADAEAVWANAGIVLKVNPPTDAEIGLLDENKTLISYVLPAKNEGLADKVCATGATLIGICCIPRISRAQKMDARSSMANIAGYRGVIEAANHFGSFFTGQITAAGKVPPAKVLVVGAGVAGLSSIGAARGLGAIVRAFDVRPAVKEQVGSLGAEFLEVAVEEDGETAGGYAKEMSQAYKDAQMQLFLDQAAEVDIVITTALVAGSKAPVLWTDEMVKAMKPGSVVVDLAAEQGGNCACTVPGQVVTAHGVTVVGHKNLTSRLPVTASELYAQNLVHVLTEMTPDGAFVVDHDNEVVRGALICEGGQVLWPPPPPPQRPAPPQPAPSPPAAEVTRKPKAASPARPWLLWATLPLGALWVYLMLTAGDASGDGSSAFLQHLTVFVLACFIGWQVVWNVTHALHTPLMSVTNAISGIIIVGGLLQASGSLQGAATLLGLAAVFFATINVSGGFLVTKRMLQMFRK
jgi:H+-translocating NAD(P) transhydrogenase subunit alpha